MDNARHIGRGARYGWLPALLVGLLLLVVNVSYAQTDAELFPPKPEPAVYVQWSEP